MDEDDVITCQLAFYAKNPGYVHQCLYYHYANPESMTHVTDKDKQLRQWNEIIENRKWIITFLESKDEPNIKAGIFKHKYCVKQYISRITGRSSQKTYSEINLELLTSKILSSSHRISNIFFLYCYPLYSFKTKLFNWVKQLLAPNNTLQ
jgi:adenine-specific DNA methylase